MNLRDRAALSSRETYRATAQRIALVAFAGLLATGRAAPLGAQEPSMSIFLPALLRDRTPAVVEQVGRAGGEGVRTVITRGQHAWVGQGQRVVALDVADPTSPRAVGATGPLGRDIVHLRAVGTRGYAVGAAGLHVLELADPLAPRVLGHLVLPGTPAAVSAAGGTALVALGKAGLAAVDVSDPARPRLGAATGPDGPYSVCSTLDVYAIGRFAFVANGDCGLRVFQFNGPDELRAVGQSRGNGYHDISVSDGYAYLSGEAGVTIVDVRDPLAPASAGRLPETGERPSLGPVEDVYVTGGRAYVSSAYDGSGPERLWVFDVADPRKPSILAVYPLGNDGEVRAVGDRVYVAEGSLSIVDVSDPAAPRTLGRYELLGGAIAVDLVGDRAYVLSNTSAGGPRLFVFDVTRLEAPVELGTVSLPGKFRRSQFQGLHVHGRQAFVAAGNDGVFVVDIGDPAAPRLRATIVTPGWAEQAVAADDRLYVAQSTEDRSVDPVGVLVFDVRDPAQPRLIATIPTGLNGASGVAVAHGHVFVSAGGLHVYRLLGDGQPAEVVYDQRDPNTPSWITRSVAAYGDLVYVAGAGQTSVFDVAEPAAPQWLGSVRVSSDLELAVADDRLYAVRHRVGVAIVDVTDPRRPFLAEFVRRANDDSSDRSGSQGWAMGADAEGDRLLIADLYEGLVAYRVR